MIQATQWPMYRCSRNEGNEGNELLANGKISANQSLRAGGDRLPYIATLHLIRLLNEKVSGPTTLKTPLF